MNSNEFIKKNWIAVLIILAALFIGFRMLDDGGYVPKCVLSDVDYGGVVEYRGSIYAVTDIYDWSFGKLEINLKKLK